MKQSAATRVIRARNEQYARDMQELRRSNAAGKHKSKKDYRRKPKHFKGWA